MKFISRSAHSKLDYLVGSILITTPFILWTDNESAMRIVPAILGGMTILIALSTDYEGGIIKLISFRAHLWIDMLQSVILGLSPFFFGFAHRIWLAFVAFAALEICIVCCTTTGVAKKDPPGAGLYKLIRLRQKWERER